jgi:hypothetical protein
MFKDSITDEQNLTTILKRNKRWKQLGCKNKDNNIWGCEMVKECLSKYTTRPLIDIEKILSQSVRRSHL